MTFCGQCGLQLSPGTTRCPRCGAIVEEPSMANGELHTDDPTIASQSILGQYQQVNQVNPTSNPQTPRPPLILRSSGTNNYDNNDATSQTRSVDYSQQAPLNGYPGSAPNGMGTYNPISPNPNTGYQGYPSPSNSNYAPQGPYPTYHSQNSYPGPPLQTIDPSYGQQISSQSMGYSQTHGQYPQTNATRNTRGKRIGMTLIIVGLVLILFAIILFALGQGLI
jgi:hypothetical protein